MTILSSRRLIPLVATNILFFAKFFTIAKICQDDVEFRVPCVWSNRRPVFFLMATVPSKMLCVPFNHSFGNFPGLFGLYTRRLGCKMLCDAPQHVVCSTGGGGTDPMVAGASPLRTITLVRTMSLDKRLIAISRWPFPIFRTPVLCLL